MFPALTYALTLAYTGPVTLTPSLPEPLAAAFDALAAAVARAETAFERSAGARGRAADSAAEMAAMQDDRTRLAQELASALEAGRALKAAQAEAERRVEAAAALIEKALADSAAYDENT